MFKGVQDILPVKMGRGVCKIVINTDVKGQYLQTGVMMKFHLGSQ